MAKPHHNGEHQRVRAEVAKHMTMATRCVLCGQVRCPRTGEVLALQRWHLAHDDERGEGWLGPSHIYCNESSARESPRYRGHRKIERTNRSAVISRGRLRRIADGAVEDDDDVA